MVVRITKCTNKFHWYKPLVGSSIQLSVEEGEYDNYKLIGQPLYIWKEDCEEVKDVDTTKIDVHDVVEVAYVGEYAKKGFHLSEKYNWDFVEENGRMTIIPTEK